MATARSFESTPESVINAIGQNLDDRYPRDAIIKELLQNADDAGATAVDVAWIPAPEGMAHELLHGPALVVVNDGTFDAIDDAALCRFGLSHKPNDNASIGKFGLGLKSVFHLCEAFFFLAPSNPGGGPERPYGTLANPWRGTDHHAGWNDVEDRDLERIERHLAPFLNGRDRWFCLWIPLRRRMYCRDASFRGDRFDGDQPTCDPALFGAATAHTVGRSLPLLHSVRTVTLWNTSSKRLAEIRLAESSGRSQFRAWATRATTAHEPIHSTSGGAMAVIVGDDRTTLDYGLAQSWCPSLLELTEDDSWPKSFSAARGRQVHDKALPHGAVCLARWTGSDQPGPDVAKAVFLPLGAAGDSARFALTLHGCFFVDAGRRDIIARTGDIRSRWNHRLLRECVYPNLLPAVQQLASSLSTTDTFALTKCLSECVFIRTSLPDLCGNRRWLHRWTESVQAWTIAGPEYGRVLTIPHYGDDAGLPGRALPALTGIAKSCVLTPSHWPRLESGSPDPWADELLAGVVTSFAVERWLADSAGELAYLAQLLEMQPGIGAATVTALTQVLRRAFSTGGNAGLERHADVLTRLVALVPAGRRLRLALVGEWPVDVRKAVCGAATSVLIVPMSLGPADDEGTGQLLVNESADILHALAGAMTPDRSPNTASDVVEATQNRQSLLDRVQDLTLWLAQRLTKGNWERLVRTARQIRSDRDRRCAYIGPANEYARDLALAADDDVWVVVERAAGTLFSGGGLPKCDANSVLAMLHAKPRLAATASRAALLRRFLDDRRGGEFPADFKWAARYLLHGSAEIPTDVLLMEEGVGGIWVKVAGAALAVSALPNRLLPGDALTSVLNTGDKVALGIASLNPEGVAALLREVGATRVSISVSDDERRDILRGLDDCPDLIRALPLHDRADGRGPVRIENVDGHRFYWVTDEFQSTTLARHVTLLRPCADSKLAAIQKAAHPDVFDAQAAARLAIALGPAEHWREVLEALPAVDDTLKEKLAQAEWLPVEGGCFARPDKVLHCETCNEEIANAVCAVGAVPGDPIPFQNLVADVRKHTHLKRLARLFPRGLRLWGAVGNVLRREERFRIGQLDDSLDLHSPDGIERWLDAFRNAPADVMAVRPLVERAFGADPDACTSTLLPTLKDGELSPARAERVLRFLQMSDERGRGQRVGTRTVHNAYLRIVAQNRTAFRELLPRLNLLSRTGDWTDPAELCVAVGLDPAHTLAAEQEEILTGLVKRQPIFASDTVDDDDDASPRPQVGNDDFAAAAITLRDYFEPWRSSEETERWAGAFLALLGDFEPLRELAADLLFGPSPDVIRLKSGVQNGRPIHEPGGGLESPARLFSRQRVLVQVTDPRQPVAARNLFGNLIPGGVKAVLDFQDLFIGYGKDRLDCPHLPDVRVRCLHLRKVVSDDFDRPTDLRELLARTGDLILKVFYGQFATDFGAVLDEYSGDDGFAIRVAQETFFDGAPYYLRMLALSATRHERLREVLTAAGRAARRASDEAAVPDRHLPGESAIKLKEKLRAELRGLLENDESVRAELVNAVQRKVKEFRYERRAVPFELFQNADDAYVERNAPADQTSALFVETASTELFVIHDGRPINRPPAVVTDGDAGGYAYDIAKMLSLGHSEKAVGPVKDVTGHFGLGFKSVFLICDRPRVVSGRLAFEVLGGVYPKPLLALDAKALRGRVLGTPVRPETATIFHLAVRDAISPAEVVADFRRMAHLLVAFAKRIRSIHLDRERTTWAERELVKSEDSRVVMGNLTPLVGEPIPPRAVVIRTPDGDLMFGLDADGLTCLPDDIPTVWVTAPTGEFHKTGYAVNGAFSLDVGRSQVDWNADRNHDLFERLGSEFGAALVAVFDEDWGVLRAKAQLSTHDRYAFWDSVWECFTAGASVPEQLKRLVWDQACGCAARVYLTRRALPTGVPLAKHRVLTSINDVSAALDCELDVDDQSTLRAVAEWPSFRAFAAGTLASGRLWRKLRRHADWAPDVLRVDLATLLRRELELSPDIDADRAHLYGQVVTRDRADLRELLRFTARFRSRAGHWALAQDLLLPCSKDADHRDEVMRAAFAPPEHVLDSAYTDSAAEFFHACRDHMVAPIDKMVAWAVQADGDVQREAVRRYMAEGKEAFRFNQLLRERVSGTWLESITDDQIEAAAGDNSFAADVMRTAIGRLATHTPPPDAQPLRHSTSDAAAILNQVAKWWRRVSSKALKKYDQIVYPDGRPPQLTTDGLGADPASRIEWLKLFITGIVQTVGRVTADQNRAFVRLCETERWLTTLADHAEGPPLWLAAVERYIDRHYADRIRYFHWLRHFVSVVTVSRHLDAYVQSFLAVDRFEGRFTPRDVLSVRTSRQFQFGGPDAPTLAPILGIGSCFVLRELVRTGLVTRDDVHPYCYAPVSRLRRFLSKLGWKDDESANAHERSRSIYEFMAAHHADDATFGNSFDIPLLMYLKQHPDPIPATPPRSRDGDFITLWDGRRVPRR